MGSAQAGDTLRNIGEPLLDVLSRAPARAAGVQVGNPTTVVAHGDDEQPAHVAFDVWRVGAPDQKTAWWMAECHWGDAFRPPGYRDVVTWIVLVLPWTLIGYFQTKYKRLWDGEGKGAGGRVSRVRDAIRALFKAGGRASRVRDVILALLALFGAVVLGPLMAAVLVLVLLLAVPLSRIPVKALQSPGKALIRVLSASLGDVYMLARESFDRRAVDQQLNRDLNFLLERCDRVAIVAHSAGSYLTHCLLNQTEPGAAPSPGRVPLLVTYGQAVWRVHAVQNLEKEGGNRRRAVLASIGVLICGVLTIVLVVADVPWAWPVATALFGLVLCFRAFEIVRKASMVAQSSTGLGLADPQRWRDYVASTDPVPDGLMPKELVTEEGRKQPRSYEGVRVHNSRSVLSDHNGYSSNQDVFLNGVARDLLWAAGHDVGGQSTDLHDSWVGRRGRTRWLSTARVTHLAAGGWLLTVAGWSGGAMAADTSTAMRLGTWLVEKLPQSWTKSLFGVQKPTTGTSVSELTADTSLRAKLVGLAVLALLLVLIYSTIRSLWSSWDRRSARQALGRKSGGSPLEQIPKIGRTRQVFVVAWLTTLTALLAVTWWWQFARPEGTSVAMGEGQRMADWFFVTATVVLALSCLLASAYTLWPAQAGRDAKAVSSNWDPGRSTAPPPPSGSSTPDSPDWQALLTLPAGWRAQLPDAEGQLTRVVHSRDRIFLESRWEGTPATPLRTTSAPGGAVLSGCRLVIWVAQVLDVRDGALITTAHYVNGVLHPAPLHPANSNGPPD